MAQSTLKAIRPDRYDLLQQRDHPVIGMSAFKTEIVSSNIVNSNMEYMVCPYITPLPEIQPLLKTVFLRTAIRDMGQELNIAQPK